MSKIYVYVGGTGTQSAQNTCNINGGYNGGGKANNCEYDYTTLRVGTGGGATHIAKVSGLLSSLSSHATNGNILIVAGGGGGGDYSHFTDSNYYHSIGGNGGGIQGNATYGTTSATREGGYGGANYLPCPGGAQSAVTAVCGEYNYKTYAASGTFGKGGDGNNINNNGTAYKTAAGAGAGYYGGGAGKNWAGGGGSGYIASSNLISGGGVTKHMTCYSCTTSSAAATLTYSNTTTPTSTPTADVARIGNGYARITYLGTSI